MNWRLTRDAFGSLVFVGAQGETIEGVTAVRAFPLTSPQTGIALLSPTSKELAWIDTLDQLDAATRELVAEELAAREFMPAITRIRKVSGFATPSTWTVDTDRGATSFVLRGEEDIRRVGQHALLIADKHGIQFVIRDMAALDAHSRKILDRFL